MYTQTNYLQYLHILGWGVWRLVFEPVNILGGPYENDFRGLIVMEVRHFKGTMHVFKP